MWKMYIPIRYETSNPGLFLERLQVQDHPLFVGQVAWTEDKVLVLVIKFVFRLYNQ